MIDRPFPNLRKYFRPQNSEYTAAYAYSEVEMRGDADVRLDVTCDDDIVVWTNDQLMFPIPGEDNSHERIRIRVRLHDGTNQILAKILNKPHGFKFSLRIVSEDGQPHRGGVGIGPIPPRKRHLSPSSPFSLVWGRATTVAAE